MGVPGWPTGWPRFGSANLCIKSPLLAQLRANRHRRLIPVDELSELTIDKPGRYRFPNRRPDTARSSLHHTVAINLKHFLPQMISEGARPPVSGSDGTPGGSRIYRRGPEPAGAHHDPAVEPATRRAALGKCLAHLSWVDVADACGLTGQRDMLSFYRRHDLSCWLKTRRQETQRLCMSNGA